MRLAETRSSSPHRDADAVIFADREAAWSEESRWHGFLPNISACTASMISDGIVPRKR